VRIGCTSKLLTWVFARGSSWINSAGVRFVTDSVLVRLPVFAPDIARNRDCCEDSIADRRLDTITESCRICFHDAAAAGAQLTMTAILSSTALQEVVSGVKIQYILEFLRCQSRSADIPSRV
jgi:hypothetical protein